MPVYYNKLSIDSYPHHAPWVKISGAGTIKIRRYTNPIPIAIGELITPFLKNYAVMKSWRNVCMGQCQ